MTADPRSSEPLTLGYFPAASHTKLSTEDFQSRRPTRSSSSVPPLVRTDTTHSSHGQITPTAPYQGTALLPPLDPQKFVRTLPPPIPSVHSLVASPLDGRPKLPHIGDNLWRSQNQEIESGSQWPALLRATALARDADLHDEELQRERGPPS
jgi:hypothetical protein